MTFNDLVNKIFVNYENGAITDDQLVQIIELSCNYLNAKTLTNYSISEKISYNGAKKRKLKYFKIDGVKFVIDH